jgi:uncharacterized Zn-binding protein involved in type VI secretion
MPSIAIAPGTVVDAAGVGTVIPSNATVLSGGSPILLQGDVVTTHSIGDTVHPANVIATGSATVRINGKGVAFQGSIAACGGPVATTFNPTVQIGI